MTASMKTARPKDQIRAAYYDQLGGGFGKKSARVFTGSFDKQKESTF